MLVEYDSFRVYCSGYARYGHAGLKRTMFKEQKQIVFYIKCTETLRKLAHRLNLGKCEMQTSSHLLWKSKCGWLNEKADEPTVNASSY